MVCPRPSNEDFASVQNNDIAGNKATEELDKQPLYVNVCPTRLDIIQHNQEEDTSILVTTLLLEIRRYSCAFLHQTRQLVDLLLQRLNGVTCNELFLSPVLHLSWTFTLSCTHSSQVKGF